MKNLGYSKFAARKSIEEALANDESAQKDSFDKLYGIYEKTKNG